MSATANEPELMRVSLDLVDEPDIAMRQSFDPVAMEDLVDSMRAVGVIQPLALVRCGERFRVAAGHRRSIAAVLAGLSEVPANVYPEGTPLEEILKNHENGKRERVNPADEAQYFMRLLTERCGGDVHRLVGMVGEKQSYVEGRLDLLRGYPEVIQALQERRINISVAIEFNRYKDQGLMRAHLASAIEGGTRAREVVRWRTESERLFDQYPQPEMSTDPLAPAQVAPPSAMKCIVCDDGHDAYNLEFIYIHRGGPCRKILERAIGPLGGGGE